MFVMGVLLLMSSTAFANDVRMMTLGDVPYWKDAGDVDTWFGDIANYGDIVWINFMGLNANEFNLTKTEDTFGTYFISIGGDAYPYMNAGGDDLFYSEKVALGYGYALEAATIGVYFQMYESMDLDDDPADFEASVYDFGAGVDYDLGDATNVDFTFMYGKMGDDSDMGFGVRAFYNWKDGVELIPAFMYNSISMGDDSANGMMFGLGFAYTVNEDNSLILGFDYMKTTWTISDVETSWTTMPGFYLGLEHDVNDWLTVRTSGKKDWVKDQDDNESYPFDFTFGFGIHLGDFDLDVAYDESQIFDTFNWFMGGPDGLGVYALQIKYYF